MFDQISSRVSAPPQPQPEPDGSIASRMALQCLYDGLPSLHLLVVEDDIAVGSICHEVAAGMGFTTGSASSMRDALAIIQQQSSPIDILLLDLKLPDGNGLDLLRKVRSRYSKVRVIVMTAFATVASAVEAMRIGADDYLTKPFGLEDLKDVLERSAQRIHFDLASRMLRERLRTSRGLGELIGVSPAMQKVYRILSKVVYSSHPVLIVGESGTGKETVARTIHENGPNASSRFVAVECATLAASSMEGALFGYSKGASRELKSATDGALVSAGNGTVLLEEVSELPLDIQAKLVRAIQEKGFQPVGAAQAVPFSARILASSSRDLVAMMERGQFRRDLYYRLNIVNLKLPPLRERKADIPVLAQHFLERVERESGRSYRMSEDSLRLILEYDWPGNVRELQNAIERTCALSSGPVLHTVDLPTQLQDFREHFRTANTDAAVKTRVEKDGGAIVSISEMEKKAILGTIRQLNGDKMMAARLLGIGKTTLYRKLKEYGLTDAVFSAEN